MKRFWAGLLCLMLLCGAVCAETLNGRNASGNVSIPYGVLNIESEAFAGCADIISLRIPETVKSLGDGAFRDCPALTTAVIEEGLTTIGAYAFAGNGALRSVTLPDSVLSIEDTAFEDCASLTLTVAEGSYAEQYAKKLGIPYTHEQSGDAKVWINRRYMDNLGLVDPVTLDELSEVVQLMMTCDADGNGIADELVAAAATEDDLRLIPQAVGASQEQASLFLASGKLGTCKVGAFSFDVLPLFVVKLEIPAEYQADYEAFEPTLPSVTPTQKPAVTPTPAPTFNPNAKVWINRRYMDNLGLVDPVTLDELSEVVQLMMTCDADGNGIADELVAAAATEDDLRLIPQAVGASQEQASLFLASGKLGTCKVGAFSFDVLPLFVVKLEIPAEYQADYEAFEPTLPSVTPTPRPTANPNAKVWINRTFMDNMGLVDPATLDELESVIEIMKSGDPDGNGIDDTIIAAAGNADELCLIPQAVGTTKEQAALFIAAGNLGTTVIGEIDFEKQPLFVVADVIPAEYQADYEAFEPKLPSVTPTPRPTANPNAKVWINRTFMDNMGLVDPATLDELESVIEAMKTGDPDGNGVDDTIIGAAGNADELCLIPQAVGTTKEQAALFIAAGNLRTTVTGEIDFEKQPLFVVTDTIPAAYQAIYERF